MSLQVTIDPFALLSSISHKLSKFKACSYLNGTMTFDTNSCNEAYSCKGVIGVASVGSGSCNGSRGCMNLSGNSIIRDEACNGSGACINFANGVTVGEYVHTLLLFSLDT